MASRRVAKPAKKRARRDGVAPRLSKSASELRMAQLREAGYDVQVIDTPEGAVIMTSAPPAKGSSLLERMLESAVLAAVGLGATYLTYRIIAEQVESRFPTKHGIPGFPASAAGAPGPSGDE